MLSQFTWMNFIETTIVILFLYYLAILVIFYRSEILQLLSHCTDRKAGQVVPNKDGASIGTGRLQGVKSIEAALQQAEPSKILTDAEISAIHVKLEEAIETTERRRLHRNELLASLTDIVGNCITLKNTDFAEAINANINSELQIHSLAPLNKEEFEQIWQG